MNKKIFNISLLAVLWISILPISGYVVLQKQSNPKHSYTNHDSIEINGNAELSAFCTVGDGTPGNPYIIENFLINGNGSSDGITIRNTDAHVQIRNNMLVNHGYGIYLFNVKNVNISFNTLSGNNYGISIWNSNDSIIFGNTITDSTHGIVINSGINIKILSNVIRRIENNGIEMMWTNNSIISANSIEDCAYYGIAVYYANQKNNVFESNLFTGCSMLLQSVENFTIGTSNKVNGKPIRFYVGVNGLSLANEELGQLILFGVNNSEFRNLTISGGSFGVLVVNVHNNIFREITSTNRLAGIYMEYSKNNSIIRSKFNSNQIGAYFSASTENIIAASEFRNNSMNGIYLYYSGFNKIYYNTFINNTEHVYIESCNNYWDNGAKGNYWDDYSVKYPGATNNGKIWNTPYTVYALDQDKYPLAYIPFTQFGAPSLSTPSNSSNGTVSLQWNSIKEAEYYLIYRSNTRITGIQGLTPIANTTKTSFTETLSNGTYYYVVVAANEFMNSEISNCVEVTIASPETHEPPQNQINGYSIWILGLISLISIMRMKKKLL